jgi:hypothetical protein
MQTLRLIIAASGLALLLPAAAYAQSADEFDNMTPEQRREYVQGLSDAERQAWHEQRREQWAAMSDAERQAARKRLQERRDTNRGAMREQWNSMSEEERSAAREKYQERREQRRETWNNLSAEERAAARQQLQGQRNKPQGQRQERRSRYK